VKVENAGLAHSPRRWLELTEHAQSPYQRIVADGSGAQRFRSQFWIAVHRAFVQRLIESANELYTCGMHVLGERDIVVGKNVLARLYGPAGINLKALHLLDGLAHYLLLGRTVKDGEFFCLGPGESRFVMHLRRRDTFEPSHPFWNPNGYIELSSSALGFS
jgi:hypothetical protein